LRLPISSEYLHEYPKPELKTESLNSGKITLRN